MCSVCASGQRTPLASAAGSASHWLPLLSVLYFLPDFLLNQQSTPNGQNGSFIKKQFLSRGITVDARAYQAGAAAAAAIDDRADASFVLLFIKNYQIYSWDCTGVGGEISPPPESSI